MKKQHMKKAARLVFIIAAAIFLVHVLVTDTMNNWWAIVPALTLASVVFHFTQVARSKKKQ